MSIHPQTQSSFFSLPFEIRERIYDYAFSYTDADFVNTLQPFTVFFESGKHSPPLPALALTCKGAYAETRGRMHHQAVMRVFTTELSARIGFAVHGALRYERLHRLVVVVAMEHPHWNKWLPFLEEVARHTTRVRELVIDWQPRQAGHLGRWEAKFTANKEARLLDLVAGIPELQKVWLYGKFPGNWKGDLEEKTKAKVYAYRYRWWKDPGGDW